MRPFYNAGLQLALIRRGRFRKIRFTLGAIVWTSHAGAYLQRFKFVSRCVILRFISTDRVGDRSGFRRSKGNGDLSIYATSAVHTRPYANPSTVIARSEATKQSRYCRVRDSLNRFVTDAPRRDNRGTGDSKRSYFGRTLGSPPGLPGGGITGVLLLSDFGDGARMAGSTLLGGHKTPSDLASLSPRFSELLPFESAVMFPCGVVCVGVQLALERSAAGGAVCAGGVVGAGGACAMAAPEPAIIRLAMRRM